MSTPWPQILDLRNVWESGDIRLIAREIVEKLQAMPIHDDPFLDETRTEILAGFELFLEGPFAVGRPSSVTPEEQSEFREVMNELINWANSPISGGDRRKRCWIRTEEQ
jgi:hypothetical protein